MSTLTLAEQLPSMLEELTQDRDIQLHEITPHDFIKLIEKYPEHAADIRLFATFWQIALMSDHKKSK